MRPKSLVWLVCTSVVVLFVALMLSAGGGYAREGQAAADPAYDAGLDAGTPGYLGSTLYDHDAPPLDVRPATQRRPAPPGSWVGVICGLGMLGIFIFLGILALRGTADNVVRLRQAID